MGVLNKSFDSAGVIVGGGATQVTNLGFVMNHQEEVTAGNPVSFLYVQCNLLHSFVPCIVCVNLRWRMQ